MNELFREVKAFKGGEVGIQIDIFGNCYVHRAVPALDEANKLPVCIDSSNIIKKTGSIPKIVNENSLICLHV
jgi:hypothetical protein